MNDFTVVSFNIHKGMSPLNRAVIMPKLAQALQELSPDVLCLQEVQNANTKRLTCPYPQSDWLGDKLLMVGHYGKNASYAHGHHGNATLSKCPINLQYNLDLTLHRLEWRGLLHTNCVLGGRTVAILNTHLNLRHQDRQKQYHKIMAYIASLDRALPVVLAGDFNDWTDKARTIMHQAGFCEVFTSLNKPLPKTFPARFPMVSLDRIFVRHLCVKSVQVYDNPTFARLSDHLPISATLSFEC